MALESPRLNLSMRFLDASGPDCPAAQVVGTTPDRIVKGALYDEEKLKELAAGCDVVTMEIEHVGVEGLRKLEGEGVMVRPGSRVIEIIQDKFVQKVSRRIVVVVFCLRRAVCVLLCEIGHSLR